MHASIGLVTALSPTLGYARASMPAREAIETGRGVVELVLQHGLMSHAELEAALRPERLAGQLLPVGWSACARRLAARDQVLRSVTTQNLLAGSMISKIPLKPGGMMPVSPAP